MRLKNKKINVIIFVSRMLVDIFFLLFVAPVVCVCGWQSNEKKSNDCLQHVFVSECVVNGAGFQFTYLYIILVDCRRPVMGKTGREFLRHDNRRTGFHFCWIFRDKVMEHPPVNPGPGHVCPRISPKSHRVKSTQAGKL